ncbi:MAG: LLM class F420-dependent oxidoreductase [Pseudonocardia sp.]|nr:LLM class F420-dependent oxidoreductase [Pseudonocardia sp.]
MKFGVATFVTDEGIGAASLASAVEERGFHSLVVTEHSHIPVTYTPPYPGAGEIPRAFYRTLDPFVVLSAAAGVTRELRLATGVILLPQRDVIYTAKQVASLDLISAGRVVLGVGIGWNREEMSNHGTDPATRGLKANEQVAALKKLWTEEQVDFHGRFVDFSPLFSWPKPVQSPHPPIYVAGESPAALDRLLRFGDGWMPQAATPVAELHRVRQWLSDHGRASVPMMIWGAGRDESALAGYVEAQVDEVSFLLPNQAASETLRDLDELARLVSRLG